MFNVIDPEAKKRREKKSSKKRNRKQRIIWHLLPRLSHCRRHHHNHVRHSSNSSPRRRCCKKSDEGKPKRKFFFLLWRCHVHAFFMTKMTLLASGTRSSRALTHTHKTRKSSSCFSFTFIRQRLVNESMNSQLHVSSFIEFHYRTHGIKHFSWINNDLV